MRKRIKGPAAFAILSSLTMVALGTWMGLINSPWFLVPATVVLAAMWVYLMVGNPHR